MRWVDYIFMCHLCLLYKASLVLSTAEGAYRLCLFGPDGQPQTCACRCVCVWKGVGWGGLAPSPVHADRQLPSNSILLTISTLFRCNGFVTAASCSPTISPTVPNRIYQRLPHHVWPHLQGQAWA